MSKTTRNALEQAEMLLAVHRADDAARVVRKALVTDPTSSELHCMLARTLFDDDPEGALRAAQRGVALAPEHSDGYRLAAIALLALERRETALGYAERAVALGPRDANACFVLARALLVFTRYDEAETAGRRTLELAPASSLGHHALGLVAFARREPSRAEEHYRAALGIDPNDSAAINNLGLALLRQGKTGEAADVFVRAGRTDPRSSRYRRNLSAAARRHVAAPITRRWHLLGLRTRKLLFLGFIAASVAVAVVVQYVGGWTLPVIAAGILVPWAILHTILRRRHLRSLPPVAQELFVGERRAAHGRILRPNQWSVTTRARFAFVSSVVIAPLVLFSLVASSPVPSSDAPLTFDRGCSTPTSAGQLGCTNPFPTLPQAFEPVQRCNYAGYMRGPDGEPITAPGDTAC